MEQVLASRPAFSMSRKIEQELRFKEKYKNEVKMNLENSVKFNELGGLHIPSRKITDEELARLIRTFFKMGLTLPIVERMAMIFSEWCMVNRYVSS